MYPSGTQKCLWNNQFSNILHQRAKAAVSSFFHSLWLLLRQVLVVGGLFGWFCSLRCRLLWGTVTIRGVVIIPYHPRSVWKKLLWFSSYVPGIRRWPTTDGQLCDDEGRVCSIVASTLTSAKPVSPPPSHPSSSVSASSSKQERPLPGTIEICLKNARLWGAWKGFADVEAVFVASLITQKSSNFGIQILRKKNHSLRSFSKNKKLMIFGMIRTSSDHDSAPSWKVPT